MKNSNQFHAHSGKFNESVQTLQGFYHMFETNFYERKQLAECWWYSTLQIAHFWKLIKMLIFSTDTLRLLPDVPMAFQEETQVWQKYICTPMALGNTTAYHVLYMCVKSQTLKNYSTLKMLKYCAKRTTISQFEDVKRIRKKVKQHKHKARWAGVSKSPPGG